jgi:hypothetical protein
MREDFAGWLWEVYARACREDARARQLGQHDLAKHWQKQARFIGNLLAQMTKLEHPITR